MKIDNLLKRALDFDFLSLDEGVFLYQNASTTELMWVADEMRKIQVPSGLVTWIIDRNANTTNVCIANCKFCNFFVPPGHIDSYVTTMDQYREKIKMLYKYGGKQLLLQGGHHPDLGLKFYTDIFSNLKSEFPDLKLNALGPPEIVHISQLERMTYEQVLTALVEAGLDTLPGAGAEILVDRVRKMIAQGKCTVDEWLDVMRTAHQMHISTSATMMFGSVETIPERFEHFIRLREVQSEKPADARGFNAFIPWTYQDEGTILGKVKGVYNEVTDDEYIRMIATSRIMMPNIKNIQASWLTVGKEIAQICLHGGANDFGSIMIEENVVSAAGAPHRFTSNAIQEAIQEAGFEPQLRNQLYEYLEVPEELEQQVIDY